MRDDKHLPSHVLGKVQDWWQHARDSWRRIHELDLLSDAEVERLAKEVGMTSAEFRQIAAQPNGSELLLDQRLASLHLDPEHIRWLSSALLRDLQRTCARCADKKRCAADFAESENPVGWESYCPNAGTLRTLM